MVATSCFWKFSTEVAISEFFEKVCPLIIEIICKKPEGKRIIFKFKNLYNLLIKNKEKLVQIFWLKLKNFDRRKFKSLKGL